MQVRTVRLGRKRRNGRRKPSGDLVAIKISREFVARGMPHRRNVPEHLRDHEKAESELGRLNLHGDITDKQYEAGVQWRRVYGAFIATIGPPQGLAGRGYGTDLSEDECERRKNECLGALTSLKRAGGESIKIVNKVVLEDHECMRHWKTPLVWGLVELERHFRPEGTRASKILVYSAQAIDSPSDS